MHKNEHFKILQTFKGRPEMVDANANTDNADTRGVVAHPTWSKIQNYFFRLANSKFERPNVDWTFINQLLSIWSFIFWVKLKMLKWASFLR